MANGKAIESAIRIGLALNCSIRLSSLFARKNYFYPDQPKNYQISQYDDPIAYDGYLDVVLPDGTPWRVDIERAHMEEDTGKSLHIGGATGRIHGASHSLLDYNRAGVPLVEIVTKPIVGAGSRAPEVARAYVTALRDLLKALGVSDVRMDQGSLRCDANVSLMRKDADEFGTRTETRTSTPSRASRWPSGTRCADGCDPHRRWRDRAGDKAFPRNRRHHLCRSAQGDRRGLPLFPRTRSPARAARRRMGRGTARHPA